MRSRRGNDDAAHHILELEEIDAAVVILIDGGDHHLDSVDLTAFLQPELAQDDLQLGGGDVAVAVLIEHLERLGEVVLLLLLVDLRRLVGEAEEGVIEGAVERLEVLESEAGVAGLDVGFHHGIELGGVVGLEAEEAEGLPELVDGDHAVVVLVEDVEDAPQPHRVQAGAAQPERVAADAALALGFRATAFHGSISVIGIID